MNSIAALDLSFNSQPDRCVMGILSAVRGKLDHIYFAKYGETFTEMQRRCVEEMALKNCGKDI